MDPSQSALSYSFENSSFELNNTFTIIIPAYNEEKRIKPVLHEICAYISSNNLPWNVIVSIDGNDATEIVVKNFANNYPFLSYLKGSERSGKGAAIKRAIYAATGEFILLMDADSSISLDSLLSSLDLIGRFDVIIFDRYSDAENKIPFTRRFASRGFNVLVRGILRIRVKDTQCGYKIIKTSYARKAFNNVSVSNAFFDVALLYYLKKQGASIIEVPIRYKHDDESKFNTIELVLGEGVSLISFRIRHSRFWKYIPKKLINLYYRKFRWI
jgi:glycosyltransferase involved in cell wall biosynthesis